MTKRTAEVAKLDSPDKAEQPVPQTGVEKLSTEDVGEFNARDFRKQLFSTEPKDVSMALHTFRCVLQDAKKCDTAVHDYLEAGGNCLEILQLLELDTPFPPQIIIELIVRLMLEVISKYTQYQMQCVEACRYLLNTHLHLLNKMMQLASTPEDRRTILKLLTAMITLSPSLAKEILQNIKFQVGLLTKADCVDARLSVRLAFIEFLLSFLVAGHYPTILQLTGKRYLLPSIMPGLCIDSFATVQLVLSTLEQQLITNAAVPKSLRIQVFNAQMLRSLMQLFDWRGPNPVDGVRLTQLPSSLQTDPAEKRGIVRLTHNCVVTLCTSFKHGIIRRDETLGTGRRPRNPLMRAVVAACIADETAFDDDMRRALAVRICGVCLETVNGVWDQLAPSLQPRTSRKWYRTVSFVRQLVAHIDPFANVRPANIKLTPIQFVQVVKTLLLPPQVLTQLFKVPVAFEGSAVVRMETVRTLRTMLEAVRRVLHKTVDLMAENYHRTLRANISEHLARWMPEGAYIVSQLTADSAGKFHEIFPEYSPVRYMTEASEILQIYHELCPTLLTTVRVEGKEELLELINVLKEATTNGEREDALSYRISIMRTLYLLQPSLFIITNPAFKIALEVLTTTMRGLSLQVPGPDTTRKEICDRADQIEDIFAKILMGTRLLGDSVEEVRIWINALREEHMAAVFVGLLEGAYKQAPDLVMQIAAMFKDDAPHDKLIERAYASRREKQQPLTSDEVPTKEQAIVRSVRFSPVTLLAIKRAASFELRDRHRPMITVLRCVFHLQTSIDVLRNEIIAHAKHFPDDFIDYIKRFGKELVPDLGMTDITSMGVCRIMETSRALSEILNYKELSAADFRRDVDVILGHAVHVMRMILGNARLYQRFQPVRIGTSTISNHAVALVTDIANHLKEETVVIKPAVALYLRHYQMKLYEVLAQRLFTKKNRLEKFAHLAEIHAAIEALGLSYVEATHLLDILLTTTIKDDFTDCSTGRANRHYAALVMILNTLVKTSADNYDAKPYEDIELLFGVLAHLNDECSDSALLARALRVYVQRFGHTVCVTNAEKVFASIATRKEFCRDNAKLAVALYERCDALVAVFANNTAAICKQKGLILPLLDIMQFDKPLAETTYRLLRPMFEKMLQKPQKVGSYMVAYYRGFTTLMRLHMPLDAIRPHVDKVMHFECVEVFLIVIMHSLYMKYIKLGSITDKQYYNVAMTYVHYINGMLKAFERKDAAIADGDRGKLEQVVGLFREVMCMCTRTFAWEPVRMHETFKTLFTKCLQHGVGKSHVYLMTLASELAVPLKFPAEDAEQVMEMLLGHSAFMDIILDPPSDAKTAIFYLIHTLCAQQPAIMKREHVALFFSAYTASLHPSDRRVISVLRLYEERAQKTSFYEFKPFLWGLAASSFYSVRRDGRPGLWRQPRASDVLDILNESMINATILHFPLDAPVMSTFRTNLPPALAATVYDVGFLLSVFCQLLAPNVPLITSRFTRSGALGIVAIAFASRSRELRSAAGQTLYRFHTHLQERSHLNATHQMWLRYVESIAAGTAAVNEHFQINNYSAIFLGRTALALANPSDEMYSPLSNYIVAKACPTLMRIPELLTFLHSAEVAVSAHRHFVLRLLHDGMRTKADFQLADRCGVFKMVMELYVSDRCDEASRSIILDMLARATNDAMRTQLMCTRYALSTWVHTVLLFGNSTGEQLAKFLHLWANVLRFNITDSMNLLRMSLAYVVYYYLRRDLLVDDAKLDVLRAFEDIVFLNRDCLDSAQLERIIEFVDYPPAHFCLRNNTKFLPDGVDGTEAQKIVLTLVRTWIADKHYPSLSALDMNKIGLGAPSTITEDSN